MSTSLRSNRIIIAALFLPNTVDLAPESPAEVQVKKTVEVRTPGPLKSIVEDLAEKKQAKSQPSIEKTPFSVLHRSTSRLGHPRRPSRSSSRTRRSSIYYDSDTSDAPIYFAISPSPQCNGGLKNAVSSVSSKLKRKVWVGTLGSVALHPEDLKQRISSKMRSQHESEVVWLEQGVFEGAYDNYCHQVLWPTLHYAVPDSPRKFHATDGWNDYVRLNQAFADKVAELYREGDIIWINDYHLMLVPALLRGKLPTSAPIGFFLHVAFPSSEIFRCLSMRERLLRGVLGSDLIGFQTANFARHFRQTVSRILAVEALPRGIQLSGQSSGDRFVDTAVFPMGIDVAQLKEKKREPEVSEWVAILRQRYAGMKILVGRDKLDDIQGVRQKIEAFDVFLDKHPEYIGNVVLIQVALPSSTSASQATNQNPYTIPPTILTPLSQINSKYSSLTYQPVVFLHTQDVSFSQYLALMKVADGFIVTSLREGMALRSHEFVVVQEKEEKEQGREGVLILSEFTGSYSYSGFRSCIAINPWDVRGTAAAIHQALTMADKEAHNRWEELNNHVNAQSAQAFVISFLTRCLRANVEHQEKYAPDLINRNEESTRDLKDGVGKIIGRWKHSQRRLILVDWEGTLVNQEGNEDTAISMLQKLADDKKNEVWLLSGLPISKLDRVAAFARKIGIVAENGCFIKPRPTRVVENTEWISMVSNLNMAWKTPCLEMLNYFTERTPGSSIEERDASVVWRFWAEANGADRLWARRQAAEAQNHIFDSLGERYGLRIIPGSNSFLVLPNNISRSTAVGSILQLSLEDTSIPSVSPSLPYAVGSASWSAPNLGDIEFVLAVSSDEKLLRRLNELDNVETVCTSRKGTDAKWRILDQDVLGVLNRFVEAH